MYRYWIEPYFSSIYRKIYIFSFKFCELLLQFCCWNNTVSLRKITLCQSVSLYVLLDWFSSALFNILFLYSEIRLVYVFLCHIDIKTTISYNYCDFLFFLFSWKLTKKEIICFLKAYWYFAIKLPGSGILWVRESGS